MTTCYLRWAITSCCLVGICGIGNAQEVTRQREDLKEPLYRVASPEAAELAAPAESNPVQQATVEAPADVSESPSRERPKIDPTLRTANASSAATTAGIPSTALAATDSQPKTIKDPQLMLALADAEKSLHQINQEIKDYTCLMIKREQVEGKIIGPDFIQTKVRHAVVENGKIVKPFSVYLKFLKPTSKRGREVLYLHGVNDCKVCIREAGWKGNLGAHWLHRSSPLVMKENRHEIHEIGIENLTRRLLEQGHAKDGNVAGVDYTATYGTGAELNSRPCRYLEVNFKTRKPVNESKRVLVLFDEELNIPVRYAAYDWSDRILEEYTYMKIQTNVGLTDMDFNAKNPNYNLK
ncbi:MAG: DUF1571 domain-containing protein [Planctomycetales bacterium]|nr:DUF1571 domain-containing protein [Planctomycetales bacterium]